MENNNLAESFGTLSETLNALMKLGYIHDFNIQQECLICNQTQTILQPDDFMIDKVYRFEGESNPEDQSILYAISSIKYEMKGTLVNGYGISYDEQTSKLIEKLPTNHNQAFVINKSNDATPLRPEGGRMLDSSLVEMDLYQFIEQVRSETKWNESDRNSITIFKSDAMRIVLMGLHKKASLKSHKANGVISVQVLEGKINFETDRQQVILEPGQMIALHENIMHSVDALEESFFLLTLSLNKSNTK